MSINLKSPKVKIYLILLVLSFLASVYIGYLLLKPQAPTSTFSDILVLPTPSSLQVVNIYPPAGKNTTIWVTTAIVFTFNQPVKVSDFKISINPSIPVRTFTNPSGNELYIQPQTEWQNETSYVINLESPLLIKRIEHTYQPSYQDSLQSNEPF